MEVKAMNDGSEAPSASNLMRKMQADTLQEA
jgi:hypothetical protein